MAVLDSNHTLEDLRGNLQLDASLVSLGIYSVVFDPNIEVHVVLILTVLNE